MGTLIDPIGPQPSCVGTTIFTSPWPVWIDNCPSSRNAALLPADHPGKKGMQLRDFNAICPTLTILVPDGSFQFYTWSLGDTRRPRGLVQSPCRDPETSACSFISCPLLDPGSPAPPLPAGCRQPRGLCRSLFCWRACRAHASFTAARAGSCSTQRPQHHTTPQPPNLATVLTLGPGRAGLPAEKIKRDLRPKGSFSKVRDVIHVPFLALL